MRAIKGKIYSAQSYPPKVIPRLVEALSLMKQAEQVLGRVIKTRGVQEGCPADYSQRTLIDAISYLEVDEDDDLVDNDNTRPAAQQS